MEASDVALAAILAIVGALTSKALGVMAGVAAGAAYLLWKAGSWKPAEEIIQARNFMPCTRLSKRGVGWHLAKRVLKCSNLPFSICISIKS